MLSISQPAVTRLIRELEIELNLTLFRRARDAVRVPIIASLNGVTSEGWVDYAKQIHQAGASAIELNVYSIAADLALTGRDVEERYLAILRAVKAAVPIPVAMKLSPFFSASRSRQRAQASTLMSPRDVRCTKPPFDSVLQNSTPVPSINSVR